MLPEFLNQKDRGLPEYEGYTNVIVEIRGGTWEAYENYKQRYYPKIMGIYRVDDTIFHVYDNGQVRQRRFRSTQDGEKSDLVLRSDYDYGFTHNAYITSDKDHPDLPVLHFIYRTSDPDILPYPTTATEYVRPKEIEYDIRAEYPFD